MAFRISPLLGLAVLLAASHPASAAESYDNCVGYIDTLPATVSSQGVWCLRQDLSSALTQVVAIGVAANNVTIDCNGFKLGGMQAGMESDSVAVGTVGDRQNVTVRHCNLRGFRTGIQLAGGGHVVEDNTVDAMTWQGISLSGDGSVARRNRVLTTGGSMHPRYLGTATGIATAYNVEVIDNTVDGVSPATDGSGNGQATGISTWLNQDGTASGNRVRGVVGSGNGADYAIRNLGGAQVTMVENTLNGSGRAQATGVYCNSGKGIAVRNILTGFHNAVANCYVDGNTEAP